MTTKEINEMVREAIELMADEEGLDVYVRTFDEEALLSRDDGLVVRVGDQKFQIVVVEA